MAPRGYRVAACLAVVGSAVACGDVYEANLGEEPAVSPQRTIRLDAGQSAPVRLEQTDPVLCPSVIEDVMPADAGVDAAVGCDRPAAVCEYGSSPDRQCNEVFSCSTGSEPWLRFPSERCAADQCPKDLPVAALDGLPCGIDGGAPEDELLCNMSDGVCACTTGRGGSDVHERRWACTKPLNVCPPSRPNTGQPCTAGLVCDYGSCRSKRGLAMACLSGVWAATSLDCDP
ncbi:MAG: hypothetical protein U0270_04625 [Labilithrix sp.]